MQKTQLQRPAPGVRRRARPPATTHVQRKALMANHRQIGDPPQTDAAEQKADVVAHKVVRGERNVARMLDPVHPAGMAPGGSPGRPLPTTVRRELEASFGADLGAVRMHTDPEAAALAHRMKARAFTAGRDIYLAQPPDFSQRADNLLVAHEVAHVLQQTGRPDKHGRAQATPLA